MNGIRILNASASTTQKSPLSSSNPITRYNQAYHTDLDTVNERNNRQLPSSLHKALNLHTPQAPSPLSLSDNDEFDDQDSIYDDQDWEDADSDSEAAESVNSDFNMREPVNTLNEDGEFVSSLDYTGIVQSPESRSSADIVDFV